MRTLALILLAVSLWASEQPKKFLELNTFQTKADRLAWAERMNQVALPDLPGAPARGNTEALRDAPLEVGRKYQYNLFMQDIRRLRVRWNDKSLRETDRLDAIDGAINLMDAASRIIGIEELVAKASPGAQPPWRQ